MNAVMEFFLIGICGVANRLEGAVIELFNVAIDDHVVLVLRRSRATRPLGLVSDLRWESFGYPWSQLLLLYLWARETLTDQIEDQHHKHKDQCRRPGQFDLVREGHAGEVIDEHGQRRGGLH